MLIKNATLCDHSQMIKADIRTQEGIIAEIGDLQTTQQNLDSQNEVVIDLDGKILMPSMIDLNLTPTNTTLSTSSLQNLAQKSLKGGIGTILISPDTTPKCNEPIAIELIKNLEHTYPTHFLASIAPLLTPANKLSDIATLHNIGGSAIGIQSDIDSNLLLRIAQYAQMLQIPLMCFCQDRILADGVMNEGLLSTTLGLPPIPQCSQTKEVAKIIEMLQNLPIDIILNALAYPRDFELLHLLTQHSQARFHAQVSIHHLILDESLCEGYNTMAKIQPPLVSKAQQQALLQALKNKQIHMLTSLQSATSPSQKDNVFELASFGINSLEHYFSLLYTHLHLTHQIPLQDLSALTSAYPAQILKLNRGELKIGTEADFMVINPNESYTITDRFSPYCGQTLQGKVEALITREHLHTSL